MGNSGEAFASFTAKSRRTKDGSRGSVVGKIDKGISQYNCRFCGDQKKNLVFIIIIKEINNFRVQRAPL